MNIPVNPMHAIEAHARAYRDARDVLVERAQALHDEIEAAQRGAMRGLRAAVAGMTNKRDALQRVLEAHPQLFAKPRTVVLHGVKVGFTKGAGKMDWSDDDQVVRLIRKHLPEQFGVQVEGTGDVVVIADTTAAVDKLVKALLKGAEAEGQS